MVSAARSPLAGVPHCLLLACILLLSASSAFASTDCPTGSYREADLNDITKYPIYPPPSTGDATLRSSIGDANPANYTLECSGSYCVRVNLDAVTYTMPDFYRTQKAMSSWTPYYPTSPYASSYDPTTKDWASVVSVCKALFQYEKRYASFYTRAAFHDSLSVDPAICAKAGNSNCGGADASLFLSMEELTDPANVGHDFAALTKITVAKIASWFQVSYADVLAVCGAVGPSVMNNGASSVIIGLNNQANFPVGRIDSEIAAKPGNLVFPNADVATWVAYFKARGFSMDEASALMGSHTSIQTQGCYEGAQHGGLYCQPASTNCNDRIQALRWDNHYYQDTCTPAVTVTTDDSASATSSVAITDTINQGLCAYTSDQFKNLAVWQIGRDIANSINPPPISPPTPPVAAAANATATGAAAAAGGGVPVFNQVATWDSYYCGASVFPGSYNTPTGTATVSQAAYLSKDYSPSCSYDASYKTGLPNGNNIFSKILGTEHGGKNPTDYTLSTYTNCPHTSQWGYTINDAFLSQVCLGDVPSEVSAYDASAIKNAYKTYAMSRAQWNSAYANAYIKMVSTFAKFVDDVYPNKKRFYIDGTECPSGYVVKPMYKKSVDFAMKKLSCSTWAGSNNGYNGNKGNMNTPPYPEYCMCKTAFVNVADRFGFTSRADGLPIDVSTLPSLTVPPANTAPITLPYTGSPAIEYPTSYVTTDSSSCANGVCSPSDLVSATSGP